MYWWPDAHVILLVDQMHLSCRNCWGACVPTKGGKGSCRSSQFQVQSESNQSVIMFLAALATLSLPLWLLWPIHCSWFTSFQPSRPNRNLAKLMGVTKFHNFGHISQFWQNFTISATFHNFKQTRDTHNLGILWTPGFKAVSHFLRCLTPSLLP